MFPPVLISFLSKYVVHLVAAGAIVVAGVLVVKSIREDAVQDNNAEWQQRMAKLDEKATEVVKEIRQASVQLATTAQTNTRVQNELISAAVTSALNSSGGKTEPGTFVKANSLGVCEFTPDYSASIIRIRNSLPSGQP